MRRAAAAPLEPAGRGDIMGDMKARVSVSDVLSLSVPERIQLVADIWDSIAAVPEAVELTEAQKQELDRRLEALKDNPQSGSPWDVVKTRIARAS
ncbi:MAG TPA: addiction module protein [Phycisphaerae bacterium]|nr:addiction module protein [Phycisphaerae bacterium]